MPSLQIGVTTPQQSAETCSDLLLELGAHSVSYVDGADQPLLEPGPGETPLWDQVDLVALFDDTLDPERLQLQLESELPAPIAATLELSVLEDRDWSRVWMDRFQPMVFGERLWIIPSWCQPVDPEGVNLLLDPGLAFGTGTHPTTALCLKWLDRHPPQDQVVIDYGCGSGILAIAAALLGAATVYAIDNDPQALLATTNNASHNGVTKIEPLPPQELPATTMANLLLANILAGPLQSLAPLFAARVAPGGEILLSGILTHPIEQVAASYAPWFQLEPPQTQEEWACLSGRRMP